MTPNDPYTLQQCVFQCGLFLPSDHVRTLAVFTFLFRGTCCVPLDLAHILCKSIGHLVTLTLQSSVAGFPSNTQRSGRFIARWMFPDSLHLRQDKNDQVLWKLSKEFAFCGQKIIQSTSNFHAGWWQHMEKKTGFLVIRSEVHRCILLPQLVSVFSDTISLWRMRRQGLGDGEYAAVTTGNNWQAENYFRPLEPKVDENRVASMLFKTGLDSQNF